MGVGSSSLKITPKIQLPAPTPPFKSGWFYNGLGSVLFLCQAPVGYRPRRTNIDPKAREAGGAALFSSRQVLHADRVLVPAGFPFARAGAEQEIHSLWETKQESLPGQDYPDFCPMMSRELRVGDRYGSQTKRHLS